MPRAKKQAKKESGAEAERVYLTNPTDQNIQVGEHTFEPDEPKSIPVELEEEARGKGLV